MDALVVILGCPVETKSRHLLCEYHGCDADLLDDRATIEPLLKAAARAAGATVVGALFHDFAPQGVSGVVVVEESHLSIHTWPEYGYAAVDFFTCGECEPDKAHDLLSDGLGASRAELMIVDRGLRPGRGIRTSRHFIEEVNDDEVPAVRD